MGLDSETGLAGAIVEQRRYSKEDVTKHNNQKDLWITIHNKVYNVSKYLDDHPGGREILLNVAGSDATTDFEDAGHSEDAREALERFIVGSVAITNNKQPVARPIFRSRPSASRPVLANTGGFRTMIRKDNLVKGLALTSMFAFALVVWTRIPGINILQGTSDFWRGVAVTSCASAIIFSVIGYQFSRTLVMQHDFRKYPPVLRTKVILRGPKKPEIAAAVLNPREYRQFALSEKRQLSHNVYRFVFALPKPSDMLGLPIGQHVNIRAEIDGKSVSRSYTPTSSNSDLGRMELTVKIYPGGKIGNYLLNLSPNSQVSIRGPSGSFKKYNRFLCNNIGMIAGGTGITPMYQFIRAICEDPADNTKVTLLYGNQTENDILMRQELSEFATQFPGQFKIHNVLEKPPQAWTGDKGLITQSLMEKLLPPVQQGSKYMVCGPDGMVKAVKKSLVAMGCEEPRPALSQSTDQVFVF